MPNSERTKILQIKKRPNKSIAQTTATEMPKVVSSEAPIIYSKNFPTSEPIQIDVIEQPNPNQKEKTQKILPPNPQLKNLTRKPLPNALLRTFTILHQNNPLQTVFEP